MPTDSQTLQTRSASPSTARRRSSYAPIDHEASRIPITGATAVWSDMPSAACTTPTAPIVKPTRIG